MPHPYCILVGARIVLVAFAAASAQDTEPTFGTTVVIPAGLRTQVYHLPHDTKQLPTSRN